MCLCWLHCPLHEGGVSNGCVCVGSMVHYTMVGSITGVPVFNRQRVRKTVDAEDGGSGSSMQGIQDYHRDSVPDPGHLQHFASVNVTRS